MRVMPCPCFLPEQPMPRDTAPRPARAPLADVFSGQCSAGAAVDTATVIENCNFGYARGRCAAFPADAAWDALRYSAPRDAFDDLVQIVWVAERNYSPVEHGRAHYSRARRELVDPPQDAVVHRQALAFAARYVGA
jgi:hypothetical protein